MAGADRQGAVHQLHLRSICSFTLPDMGHTVPANPSVAFVLTYLENWMDDVYCIGAIVI